jgi:hypothetical protein
MTVGALLLAPLFGYVCLKADSVVAAAIFHGTGNGLSVLATMGLEGGNDLLVGGTGLAGFLVLVVANLGLVVFDRWFCGKTITRSVSDPSHGQDRHILKGLEPQRAE